MKEVIVILFILDKKLEVKDTLSTTGDIGYTTPFFDDEYKQYLDTGAETFSFSTMANTNESQHLVVGNYIAFAYEGQFKLFRIMEINEEHNDEFIKTVYCEMAGIELINNILRPMTINGASIKKFVDTVLADTEWQLGLLDIGVNAVHDIQITDFTNVYSALQQHAVQEYGAEISLTVKIENNKVVAKYVNIYRERGKKNGFRFAYSSNVSSVVRTVDSSNLATALIGVGKNNINFKEIDAPDKPLNQDFIADEESYKRWNNNGHHIMGLFKCESESPQELLKLTRKELEKRKNPNVKYELKTELLSGNEVSIGDTVNVVDHEFNPPIYLEARVSELTISFTDPYKNECVLSNFKEVNTKITDELRGLVESKFPIHSEDIADGAVGKDQISIQYHTQLIADAVHASLVETEDLIATKADIEELHAIEAKIGTLDAGEVIAEELKAIKGNITSLESDKADIKDLDVVKGKVTHLESEKVSTNEFDAKIANIDTTITNNLNATNAEINTLKSNYADIEVLVSKKATIEDLNAIKAQIGTLEVGTVIAESLKTLNGEVTNLKSDKADINDLNAIKAQIGTLEVGEVIADKLNAIEGNISTLESEKATIEELNATKANIESLDTKVANIDQAVINNAKITNAEIDKLKAKDVEINNALIDKANVSDLTAINASVESLKAKDASIDKALINKANISDLNVINATVESMKAKVAEIDSLKAKDGEFENLLAGNLTAKNFKAGSITSDSAIIADGAIGDAQIGNVTANKITGGEIDTAKVKVKSTNGEIEISGNQLMVNDTTNISNKVNRVILGQYKKEDNTVDYGLLIRGKDGKTVMMDAEGVHNAGITDGAVDNNKISDDANIDGKKINIESVITHINGATSKIEGSSIVVDNKNLGATISEITNTQNEQSKELNQAKSEIQASVDKINLTVSNVNTSIEGQNTKIEKNSSAIDLLQNEITLKVDSNGIISAINMDASGVKILGHSVDLTGCVNFNALNTSDNEFGGLFDKEFNKTMINGGRIMTNSIKAQQIDIYGLSVKQKQSDGVELETLKISDNGSVVMRGTLESYDFDEIANTGWKLSEDGNATLNNATVRGSVILPSAGITNFGINDGIENLVFNTSKPYTLSGFKGVENQCFDIYRVSSGMGNNTTYLSFEYECKDITSLEGKTGEIFVQIKATKSDGVMTWVAPVGDRNIHFENGKGVAKMQIDAFKNTSLKDAVIQIRADFITGGEVVISKVMCTTNPSYPKWKPSATDDVNYVRFWAGADYDNRDNAPFRVMHNGDIFAEHGTFKGTFTGKVEIGNILIEDTLDGIGKIQFESQTGVKVVDIGEDSVKFGVNTTIGTSDSSMSVTKTDATIDNKDVSITRTVGQKTDTIVRVNKDGNDFLHLNGTHKLITNGTTLTVEGNETHFSNNVTVGNSIATNDMIVGNMQMKRRTDNGNKGIDFIFV